MNYFNYINTILNSYKEILGELDLNNEGKYTGRLESIFQEDFIVNKIKENYIFEKENTLYFIYKHINYNNIYLIIPNSDRYWFDLGILIDNNFYPINIKISNGETPDNIFGLGTLGYLIFGNYELDENNIHLLKSINNEELFAKKISDSYNYEINDYYNFKNDFSIDTIRDYFLLIINKNSGSIELVPFLSINQSCIKTNPKNLLQIQYNKIIIDYHTSYDDRIKNLIYKYYEYVEKKAKPYNHIYEIFK